MIPCQNLNVAEDLERLTSAYKDKPVIRGLLAIALARHQALEDVAWQVLITRLFGRTPPVPVVDDPGCCECPVDTEGAEEAEVVLDGANAQLDTIGKIVGEPRYGRDDAAYLVALRARILVNKSKGLAKNLVEIAARSVPAGIVPTYEEFYPAAFQVTAINVPGFRWLGDALGDARHGGVYGVLRASSWEAATPGNFRCGSTHAAGHGRGPGSTHNVGTYSVPVSLQECLP